MDLARNAGLRTPSPNSKEAPGPVTIDDALERFLVQLEANGRSPHTIGQYRRHVRLFGAWRAHVCHSGPVDAISHEDFARFLASPHARTRRDTRAKKATTVNALRSSLRGFSRYLHAVDADRYLV